MDIRDTKDVPTLAKHTFRSPVYLAMLVACLVIFLPVVCYRTYWLLYKLYGSGGVWAWNTHQKEGDQQHFGLDIDHRNPDGCVIYAATDQGGSATYQSDFSCSIQDDRFSLCGENHAIFAEGRYDRKGHLLLKVNKDVKIGKGAESTLLRQGSYNLDHYVPPGIDD